MRDPPRKAVYALLALAAAAASILWGIDRYEKPGGGDWTAAAPIMLGLAVAPFALYFLIEALLASVGRARLLRGERLIARWHVGAADWDRFRGIDSERLAGDVDLNNDLWIRKETPPEGIEVIVGEKSLIVDGSYHWLSTGGLPALRDARWIEGSPACLEFALRYPPGRYGAAVRTTLRVPVPASARGLAGRVLGHYQQIVRPAPRPALPPSPRRPWAWLAVLAAASGYGLYLAGPLAPYIVMIGAAVLAVFALFGFAVWLLARGA